MPDGAAPDADGGAPPGPSLWQRLLLWLPHLRRDDGAPLGERLRSAVLKPADPTSATTTPGAGSTTPGAAPMEELEASAKRADDKERLIGLVAAPLAAAVGVVVISTLISNDPAQYLANGHANPKYVTVGIYHELLVVLLALALAMMAAAWFRKRLYLGIAMALYGLAVFNLHYWGFGVPFVMGGAYYLVSSYRLNRTLREA
ncbi:MAG TPA: hypothetical protein VNG12_25320, partial [Acidimicrobiales bacterium]|nr:hypothetical protein [Acidimicrobiales bacterium]